MCFELINMYKLRLTDIYMAYRCAVYITLCSFAYFRYMHIFWSVIELFISAVPTETLIAKI